MINRASNSKSTRWALPNGAMGRLGRGIVDDLAFSPDGCYLAVGTSVGLWLYELSTLLPIALWETERGLVSALAFSQTGEWIATGNWDGAAKILDAQSGRCVTKIARGTRRAAISTLAFSPTKRYLAASSRQDDVVYVWHSETGTQIAKFSQERKNRGRMPTRALTFSPDGNLLACVSDKEPDGIGESIKVWELETGKCIALLLGHVSFVYAISFSPCGRFLASGGRDLTVRIWDVTQGQLKEVHSYYGLHRMLPAYSRDGVLYAAGVADNTISVWNLTLGEKLTTFKHQGTIRVVRFSDNRFRLAVSGRYDFKIWDANNPDDVSSVSGHDRSHIPYFLRFSANGKILASAGRGPAICWNVVQKQPQRTLLRPKAAIQSLYISADGNIHALGSKGNMCYLWDVVTDETMATLIVHEKVGYAVACAPIGEPWASADIGGKLYVWNSNGKQTVLVGHTATIAALDFAPDGKQLASASRDKTARIWDVASGEEITSLALTPLLDTTLYKGDVHQLQKRCKSLAKAASSQNPKPIEAIAFSSHGEHIAGRLWREIRLWDATTYKPCMAILLPEGCQRPYALAFSPCGRYLASGAWWQGTEKVSIRLWEVATGKNIATFWGHPTDVQDLAFSPDGTLLASGSYDGTILLWDMKPYL